MSQCVPSWDLDLHHHLLHHRAPLPSSAATRPADTPAEYDVMELTWNRVGHLATLGLRKPIPRNPSSTAAAASTAAAERNSGGGGGGTLECIVDQACSGAHHSASDATVPCSDPPARKQNGVFGANSTSQGSAAPTVRVAKRRSMSSPPPPPSRNEEEEVGCGGGGGGGGGSPEVENGSVAGRWALEADENGSVSRALRSRRGDGLGERGIASISAKRSREAAVHNQSERKRRDRINQKMKALQKLLPKSNKTDKASMLDEVIEYLKLLQAQVQMMSRIPTMMLPIAMQHQQLQLSMMAHLTQISRMSLGLGIMDPSLVNLVPPTPILHPSNFLLPSSLTCASDGGTTKLMQEPYCRVLPDMIPALMGCPTQQQPMSLEAYSRFAALYQQLYQQPLGSNQKT